MLSAWALAYGLCAALLLLLGALALRQDRASRTHRDFAAFAAFTLLMALWLASLFLYYRVGDGRALTLVGRANFAAISLSVAYGYLFARDLVGNPEKRRRIALAGTVALAALTFLTPLVSVREYRAQDGPVTVFGPLFLLFAAQIAACVLSAGWALVRATRGASAERRDQYRLVLAGFLAMAAVVIATNVALPLAFGIFAYQEAGALSVVLLIAALGYAVTARGLLDVRVVVGRTVVFAALVGALTGLYGALALLAAQAFSGARIPAQALAFNVAAVVAVGLASEPIRRWVGKRTDRWLYQGDYAAQAAAARLGERLAGTASLDDALEAVLGSVRETLRPDRIAALALDGPPEADAEVRSLRRYGYRAADEAALTELGSKARHFGKEAPVAELPELIAAWEAGGLGADLASRMESLGAEAAVPLFADGGALGLILVGRKKAGGRLSRQDLSYLGLVRSAAVAAVQKASYYEGDRTKTEFVSIAAHELLTPIAGVQGYLSMVLDENLGEVDDKARGYLGKAYGSANRLAALVKDLLSVARLESGTVRVEPRPVGVNPLVQDAVDGVAPGARTKGLAIRFAPTPDLPMAVADPARLAEVLTNLVGNAVKYTPAGSVEVAANAEGGFVRVDVRDTGLGMAEDARARLFEKFYRVRTEKTESIPGTGLGLYVTKQMVDRMGGKIEVRSEEGAGSTFTVFLPVAGGR